MAAEDRQETRALALLQALQAEPERFDLFQALRRLECVFRDRPRWGEALRPADEPARLGQEAALTFADRQIVSLSLREDGPPRLSTSGFGVFGPNGPLPLHLTEHARDRLRNSADPTLARFVDIFHHRMIALFYRAFAETEPTIARDRPSCDRFALYVGSLFGMGLPSTRRRGLISDETKLHHAGLLASQVRNADGLGTLVADLFQVPAEIEQFVGEWIAIPQRNWSRLGEANCALGLDALLGARTWVCAGKFRVILGPLSLDEFDRFLPGSSRLEELTELVRTYAGDELGWDLRLVLAMPWRAMELGRGRLGWNSWIGLEPETWSRAEFTFDPASRGRATPAAHVDTAGVESARHDDTRQETAHA